MPTHAVDDASASVRRGRDPPQRPFDDVGMRRTSRTRRRTTTAASSSAPSTLLLLPMLLMLAASPLASASSSSSALFSLSASEASDPRPVPLSSTMEGSCASSRLEAGQQRGAGSYLCYPSAADPIHKFGIDSEGRLSYYVRDRLAWSASPPPPASSSAATSTACVVFGGSACDDPPPPLAFYRMRASGTLAGYDDGRSKAWDARFDGGVYEGWAAEALGLTSGGTGVGVAGGGTEAPASSLIVAAATAGSALEVSEEGATVVAPDGTVAWWVRAPPESSAVVSLVTASPTAGATTRAPTSSPATPPPTPPPTPLPTLPTPTGSIRGFVWDDTATNDGAFAAGDAPASNVPVALLRCADAGSDAVDEAVGGAISGGDGTFSFDGLSSGSYRIQVTLPPSGANNAAASSFANNDNDGDDAGESWKFVAKNVNLSGGSPSSAAEDSDVDADGTSDCLYVAGGMWRSVYVGMVKVDDGDGSDNANDNANDNDTNANDDPITVSGTVFWDSNGDGVPDPPSSSPPPAVVSGLAVDLYDCDALPSDPDGGWMLLTRTDASGKYSFVPPSSSTVGGGTSSASAGDPNDLSAFLEQRGTTRFRVAIASPDTEEYSFVVSADVGAEDGSGSVRTSCWDVNEDGRGDVVWDAGIANAASDSGVSGVAPTPSPTIPPRTTPTSGPSSPAALASPSPPVAAPDPSAPTAPALPASPTGGVAGGYAFYDANDDGIRDPDPSTEPAAPGINVRLFQCGDNDGDATGGGGGDRLVGVQQTNGQGFYGFRNLFSGRYRVEVRPLPSGRKISSVWKGDNADVDNAVDPATGSTGCFELTGGDADISQDVGLAEVVATSSPSKSPTVAMPVVVSGMVFVDANDDGRLDDGELAFPDVRVALFSCDLATGIAGTVARASSTDENGMYGFSDVVPGSYSVAFSAEGHRPSAVWTGSADEEGKLVAPDARSDVDPETGRTACAEFASGMDVYGLDAGMVPDDDGAGSDGGDEGAGGDASPSPTSAPTAPRPAGADASPAPTSAPTAQRPAPDLLGDGTPCSGAPCSDTSMCRSKSGLCGAGLAYCNAESAWTPGCRGTTTGGGGGGATAPPTRSPAGSSTAGPTSSSAPSPPAAGGDGAAESADVCNEDGSVGATDATGGDVASREVSFAYALAPDDESRAFPSDADAVLADFEVQLQKRLACVYFDDPCLACDGSDGGANDDGATRGRGLRGEKASGGGAQRRSAVATSLVAGLSPSPPDEFNMVQACAGAAPPGCRVVDGKFAAYFPPDADPALVEAEVARMLGIVRYEMGKDDFDGVRVSYDNAPFVPPSLNAARAPPANGGEGEGGDGEGGGLSTGAVVGIVVGIVLALAVAALLALFVVVRRRRDKEDEERMEKQREWQQRTAAVPFGGPDANGDLDDVSESDSEASDGSGSSDDSDDDESGSSSSGDEEEDETARMDDDDDGEDDRSGSLAAASAVSGDTFPTCAAQARSVDVGSDIDEEEEEGEERDEMDDDESAGGSSGEGSEDDDDDERSFDEEDVFDARFGAENRIAAPQGEEGDAQRLQRTAASDERAAVYEEDHNGAAVDDGYVDGRYANDDGDYGAGGRGEYDGREQAPPRYDGGRPYDRQKQGGEYPQGYDGGRGHDADDAGSLGSAISADPPGTSYRDLPQHQQQQQQQWQQEQQEQQWPQEQQWQQEQQWHPVDDGQRQHSRGFDESPHGSFQVYESDGSAHSATGGGGGGGGGGGFEGSYQSFGHHSSHPAAGGAADGGGGGVFAGDASHRSDRSHLSRSHSSSHSQSHSLRSHSQDSRRSARSGRSARSHGSRHSQGEGNQAEEPEYGDAYAEDDGRAQARGNEYADEGGYYDDDGNYVVSEQNLPPPPPFTNDRDGYATGDRYDAGGQYASDGRYAAAGPYAADGQYAADGRYGNDDRYGTDGQYAPDGQHVPDGRYGADDDRYETKGAFAEGHATDGRDYARDVRADDDDGGRFDDPAGAEGELYPEDFVGEEADERGGNVRGGGGYDEEESYHSFHDGSFRDEAAPMPGRRDGNGYVYDRGYGEDEDEDDDERGATKSRREELDEASHAESAHTATTRRTSNATGSAGSRAPSRGAQSASADVVDDDDGGGRGGGGGVGADGEDQHYGEEEASITNIFKSLSEIQTRLATNKGGKGPERTPSSSPYYGRPAAEGAVAGPDDDGRARPHRPAQVEDGGGGGGGSWVVEDASVDGSQVSSYNASNAPRNRRPRQGQWMEPVGED